MGKEYIKHFSTIITDKIEKYAIEEPFKDSRYIFTHRQGKRQYGYCTHCKTEFETIGLKHNDLIECPQCKSDCTVKASGRGRKYLIDEVYFTYYEKSKIDSNVIIAKGIYASRNYSGDYHNIKTRYDIEAIYIFKMGESAMLKPLYYKRNSYEKWPKVSSMFGYWGTKSYIKKICYSRESIRNAVKGTPFQYSMWDQYRDDDMVNFFNLYSKYPCIEYLTKEGFKQVVEAKLYGWNTFSSINWNGKTIFKVLKINKNQLKEIKKSNIEFDTLKLKLYQLSAKDKSHLTIKELDEISKSYGYELGNLRIVLKYTSLKRADRYIDNQLKKYTKEFHSKSYTLTTWRDYILDCIKLEMDLTCDNVLFPKNLYIAHQNTIKQIKIKGNALLDKKINTRAASLQKYCFELAGLFIRPANDSKDLIDESKALHHCVASNYTTPYAEGKTNIFFIRKASEPDKPYYTLELKKGEIIQCRGKNNCAMTEEVSAFVEAFKAAKLQAKPEKVRIPA